ncbi:MAG: lipoyl domain-containing protein [Leptospiraceae bacterium]|nr:lipoyl domain-containing protein [Leptospiraceae bacterium]
METKKYLDLRVPDLGDSDKIELVKWLVTIGEEVMEGQELLELVTDKANFPVESPFPGILTEVFVQAGSVVKKDDVLGRLEYWEID